MRHGIIGQAVGAALGGAVVLALGAGLAAAPATHAKEPPAEVTVQVPQSYEIVALTGPVPEDHYKSLQVGLVGGEGTVDVTIDPTDAQDLADFQFPESCKVAGAVATCRVDLGTLEYGEPVHFKLRPKEGVKPGRSAVVKYTVTSRNTTVSTAGGLETRLNVVAGADLVHAPLPARADLTPNSTYTLPLEIRNLGTRSADGSRVALRVTVGGEMVRGELLEMLGGNYTNCQYHQYREAGARRPGSGTTMYCEFDTPLEPGRAYVLSPPLKVRAVTDEWKAGLQYDVYELSPPFQDSGLRTGYKRGTAGVLRLVPQPVTGSVRSLIDMKPSPSSRTLYLHIKDPTVTGDPDVDAVGATVRADVGKPFDVKVGIRNGGTAQTHEHNAELLYVDIPKGVDVRLADKRCRIEPSGDATMRRAKGRLYLCEHYGHVLPPGGTVLFGFRLQVSRPLAETSGFVYRTGFDEGDRFNNVKDESQLTISTSTPPTVFAHGRQDGLPVMGIAVGSAAALFGGLAVLVIRRRRHRH